jgi:hypothetical protein
MSTKVPRQVAEAAEKAEAELKQAEAAAETAAAAEAATTTEADASNQQEVVIQDDGGEPEPDAQTHTDTSEATRMTNIEQALELQGQRYNTLGGWVKQLSENVRGLKDSIQEMATNFKETRNNEKELEFPADEDLEPYLKGTEEYGFGREYVDHTGRVATAVADKKLRPVLKMLDEMRATLDGAKKDAERSKAANLQDRVTDLVPNWGELLDDPGFNHWLTTPHELADMTYGQLYDQAVASGDPKRIARFFNDYLSQKVKPKKTLESQALPERKGQSVPQSTVAAPKKSYTAAEVEAMNREMQNLFKSNPKRAEDIMREIDTAWVEGRIAG